MHMLVLSMLLVINYTSFISVPNATAFLLVVFIYLATEVEILGPESTNANQYFVSTK